MIIASVINFFVYNLDDRCLHLADITSHIFNLLHSIQKEENHFVCSLKLASISQCSFYIFSISLNKIQFISKLS